MRAPDFVLSDFTGAFLRLFPRGLIWPRSPDSVLGQTVAGLVPNTLTQYRRSTNLLIDCFPGTTVELLPEWEASLGLPDACSLTTPTMQQRVAAVVAKLIATGGQSIPYFVALAAALGFVVTVTEFWPAEADDPCDGPCYGEAWAFAWEINAPIVTIQYASADISYADDPLETWDSGELVCRLSRLSPAHTILFFGFTDPIDGPALDITIPPGQRGDRGAASTVPGPKGERGDRGIQGIAGDPGPQPADFYGFFFGKPDDGQRVMSFAAARPVDFPANLTGSRVRVLIAAEADLVMALTVNGAQVGTATIPAGGFNGALVSDGFSIDTGDVVAWISPSPADPSAANYQITLTGTR